MKANKKISIILILTVLMGNSLFAFNKGWVLNMRGNVGGSLTLPSISQEDLARLTANKMEGMTGLVGGGAAEVGYIFDNKTYFGLPSNHIFSGMGLFGRVGVTQGYTGQISGTCNELTSNKQVDVFVNVYYTPVISLGAATKAYFFNNRLAVGIGLGTKIIADTSPSYEIYSTEPETIEPEVGTIIVDDWMIKHMNPFMFSSEIFLEYNVKILPTTELILGGFIGYDVYSPKYITMPDKVMKMLIESSKAQKNEFNPKEPLKSYFINSFNFGLTFALGFKLD